MKKIVTILIFGSLSAFTHTMEKVSSAVELSTIDAGIIATMKLMSREIIKNCVSPDGTKVAFFDSCNHISIWYNNRDALCFSERQREGTQSIEFNPEGTKVVVTTSTGSEELDVIEYEVYSVIRDAVGYVNWISWFSVSADRTKVAICEGLGSISLWDNFSGEVLERCMVKKQEIVRSIGFNSEGTKVIVTTPDGSEEIDIINPKAMAEIRGYLQRQDRSGTSIYKSMYTRSVSFDRTKVAVFSHGWLSLWDNASGELLQRWLAQDQCDVRSIGFNNDSTSVTVTTPKGIKEFPIEGS